MTYNVFGGTLSLTQSVRPTPNVCSTFRRQNSVVKNWQLVGGPQAAGAPSMVQPAQWLIWLWLHSFFDMFAGIMNWCLRSESFCHWPTYVWHRRPLHFWLFTSRTRRGRIGSTSTARPPMSSACSRRNSFVFQRPHSRSILTMSGLRSVPSLWNSRSVHCKDTVQRTTTKFLHDLSCLHIGDKGLSCLHICRVRLDVLYIIGMGPQFSVACRILGWAAELMFFFLRKLSNFVKHT